ncbi:helix-turn-helix transcriptional regulator [Nisaea acidiphila]|uniref:Helix-turn-helix transcriptional regulator n=1 Tax=Nisaea acidiphila TaxID=1862145 RepID=A0A9J7B0A9_9PROT|nr:helix-turn-helix transcriptional regulator [Nisaea acidiphila]UUX52097.1 helix-turn-helix transcriptional regulator [Nisaea acidiphila]
MLLHRLRDLCLVVEAGTARARLMFENGDHLELDFTERARNRSKLKPLLEPDTFLAGRIVDDGIAVEWPCGIEIDATSLHRSAMAMLFRKWRKRHGMSQVNAAEALGLTGRTVQNYESGEQEIPRTVMLAMRGYDASPELQRPRAAG